MSAKEFVTVSTKLAQALLRFDEDNPGAPDANVEIPAAVWAEWIDLAGQVDNEEKNDA